MSPEIWFGFVGTLAGAAIGAGASIGATWALAKSERQNKRAELENFWKQEQNRDLRDFQEAAHKALIAFERYIQSAEAGHEVTEDGRRIFAIRVDTESLQPAIEATRTEAWQAVRHAEMLATRAGVVLVRKHWFDVMGDFQASGEAFEKGVLHLLLHRKYLRRNPTDEGEADNLQEEGQRLMIESLVLLEKASSSMNSLTPALDQAFQELRIVTPYPSWEVPSSASRRP